MKARCAKDKKLNLNETTVVTKPTLDEELTQFKAIVRHILKYDAEQGKATWFRVDTRAILRRLSKLQNICLAHKTNSVIYVVNSYTA